MAQGRRFAAIVAASVFGALAAPDVRASCGFHVASAEAGLFDRLDGFAKPRMVE